MPSMKIFSNFFLSSLIIAAFSSTSLRAEDAVAPSADSSDPRSRDGVGLELGGTGLGGLSYRFGGAEGSFSKLILFGYGTSNEGLLSLAYQRGFRLKKSGRAQFYATYGLGYTYATGSMAYSFERNLYDSEDPLLTQNIQSSLRAGAGLGVDIVAEDSFLLAFEVWPIVASFSVDQEFKFIVAGPSAGIAAYFLF